MAQDRKELVDLFMSHLWGYGYWATAHLFGTYLPAPPRVGEYQTDLIVRLNREYAIGLCITEEDLADPRLLEKVRVFATQRLRGNGRPLSLLLGVPVHVYQRVNALVSSFSEEVRTNIRIFSLNEISAPDLFTKRSAFPQKKFSFT